MNQLLEHAARLLDHQPMRSMQAEPLYRRSVRETGVSMPFPHFMAAVRERADHFAVIPADPILGSGVGWDPRQRLLYEAALEAAGMSQPLIVLAGDPDDAGQLGSAFRYGAKAGAGSRASSPESDSGATVTGAAADVFREAQDALTHLLHASDPDDPLYIALVEAMDELYTTMRVLSVQPA